MDFESHVRGEGKQRGIGSTWDMLIWLSFLPIIFLMLLMFYASRCSCRVHETEERGGREKSPRLKKRGPIPLYPPPLSPPYPFIISTIITITFLVFLIS
jgi:hypothetical protein